MQYLAAAILVLFLMSFDFQWWLVVGAFAFVIWLFAHL